MISVETNFIKLFQVVDSLVDERIGILRYVKEARSQAGAPAFFHFYSRACDTGAFSLQHNFAETGGASAHRPVAMAKAIGEAVERYCAAIYSKEEFFFETYESAPFRCVAPEEFALYSPAQYEQPDFPYVPFSKTTPIRWTEASDARSGEIWHVPASMVYLPYFYNIEGGEPPVSQSISTGLACHCSESEAAVSALCEVVERDAFTITWQAKLAAPPIRLSSLSEQNRDLVKRFECTGSTIRIMNITLDHGIPTILSILMHPLYEAPAFVFAASAHLNPEIAVRKSLEELAHTRRLAVELKHEKNPPTMKQNVHVKLYTDHANRSAVDFLLASQSCTEFQELRDLSSGNPDQDLAMLSRQISNAGHRPLLSNVTTQDIRDLGLFVMRAVIPGFHPLFMGHHIRALGGWRLWNVPRKLGYKGITKETGDNPAPHPFP